MGLDKACGVLEIGPGIGALTVELAARANKVVAVELDKKLLPVLSETLQGFSNVTVINEDALKIEYRELIDKMFYRIAAGRVCQYPLQYHFPLS